ncbi:MAG: hypothetical protein PHD45_04075 [Bacteroidales bacterium]|nr:hypothetical protein [Bacteroidales bacterium]
MNEEKIEEKVEKLLNCKETTRIFGYSERGILNSLMFEISKDKKLMIEFLKLLPEEIAVKIGTPACFKILLDHSLSGFGSPDLIVIAHYIKPEDKKVIFLEAKVQTLGHQNWNLQALYDNYVGVSVDNYKQRKMGSNLFFQLKLKRSLVENLDTIRENNLIEVGVVSKKIGNNAIVLRTVDMIDYAAEYFYVGIVPHCNFSQSEEDKEKYNFLLWKDIEKFCEKNKLQNVLDMFDYNKGQIY